jgi:uncharacterized membrane protein
MTIVVICENREEEEVYIAWSDFLTIPLIMEKIVKVTFGQ